MKKGFTLIELMSVIIIMGLIMVTVVPTILNQVKEKEADISETSKKVIYLATYEYVKNDKISYPIKSNNVFCVTLEELVNAGRLQEPVMDGSNVISLNRVVKVTINEFNDLEYSLLSVDDVCTPVTN